MPVRVLSAGLPGGVPWRAAVVALVLAVVVGVTLLARAQVSAGDAGVVVPPRGTAGGAVTGHTSSGREPGRGEGPLPVGGVAASPTALNLVASSAPAGGVVVVHVVGRVRRPGLVRLPAGSRVWDAVVAAGGSEPAARLDRLNLARPLSDGEQVLVPGATDPVPSSAPSGFAAGSGVGGSAAGVSGAPVDLNTATTADLDRLPGVGPVLADRILAWRTQHGRFSQVEELGEVPGIGDKLLARLTPLVRV
jgi:competence protein ComEA